MQPCPCCLITSQSQNPLHTHRTGTILLAGHPPDGAKPQYKWLSRPLKDRSRNDRDLVITRCTSYQLVSRVPAFLVPAARAPETLRPTQFVQILSTGLFRRKSLLQLRKILGVILHTLLYYILYPRQSRGYPYNLFH